MFSDAKETYTDDKVTSDKTCIVMLPDDKATGKKIIIDIKLETLYRTKKHLILN